MIVFYLTLAIICIDYILSLRFSSLTLKKKLLEIDLLPFQSRGQLSEWRDSKGEREKAGQWKRSGLSP